MFFNFSISKGNHQISAQKRVLTLPSESTKSANSHRKFLITPKSIFTDEDQQKLTHPSENHIQYSETSQLKFRQLKNSQTVHENLTRLTHSSWQIRRKTIDGDVFDVYGDTKYTEPELFTEQNKIYSKCKHIIEVYQLEISKLLESKPSEQNKNNRQNIMQFMEINYSALMNLKQLVESSIRVKNNRTAVESLIQQMIQENYKMKNNAFAFQTHFLMGKIAQFYKNPTLAVLLYKIAKRHVDTEQMIPLKMKTYRQLGQCFLLLKPSLSILYFSKYLMCAWKTNNIESEIQAYDLMGKYYYYLGDINRAMIFHAKSLDGDFEHQNSALRRLGISKLLGGSINKIRKERMLKSQDDNDFMVSSDEEVLDIQFKEKKQYQQEVQKRQKYQLRSMPNFINDDIKLRQQISTANKNIRQDRYEFKSQIMTGNEVDLKKLKGISLKSQAQLGECKQRIFLQHQTANRNLGVYQNLELTKNSQGYKKSSELAGFLEKYEMKAIEKTLNKYYAQIKFILSWMAIKLKEQNGIVSTKRVGYQIK